MFKFKMVTFFIIFMTLFLAQALSQPSVKVPDKIVGTYWSPTKEAKIQVFKKAEKYYGRIIWVATPAKDTKNPKEALRKRDILGIELLSDFTYDDEVYTGGEIYDPGTGKTYDCKISFSGENLKVKGFVGISLFGRTEIFERIK